MGCGQSASKVSCKYLSNLCQQVTKCVGAWVSVWIQLVTYFCSCEGHDAIMASSCYLSTKSWVHSGRSEFTIQVMTHLQPCSGWRFGNHSLHPKLYKSFFKCLCTFSLHAYKEWHGGAVVSTVAMQQVGLGFELVVSWSLRTALWYPILPVGLQCVCLNPTHLNMWSTCLSFSHC